MSTESELQAKYNAAVERYQAAVQAEATAKKEKVEKWTVERKTQDGTKQYYLAWAEINKAEIAFTEKVEQRYTAAYTIHSLYADCMKYRYGDDSKEAQIAQHRAELARTREFVYSDSSPYWIKWYKLDCKAWWVYYEFRAEGYDKVAAELKRAREAFWDHIKGQSNGKAYRNARDAAVVALKKWERWNDCVAWDKAKQMYDSALAKWNEFIPKGDQYAKQLEETITSRIKSLAPISELLCGHIGKSIC
ncbi:uncharacterized protein TM35_000151730 [Trypanosoma theileri]|uniref:Uncharacterized protein n=1 Tax=Trypanosoma theileri TaxID=67003 RepID=A0A1X0NVP5_9TRYP|nr:uncharacterized protein TM35_000151730 [Trypanosoma theileri]ORC88742.1 hypothetical protein TM35_000151730 [Trypanosoma theileri]